ncbi:uncharacterized protein LOC134221740 [Armigeres subalbatus]|uniref:uncharacterized protein LOC134221740 n=1 Tax=Armigeres subalbatus TaxID=124917 RepID=UPI002ED102BE
MSVLVLPKVTVNLPTSSISIEEWNVPDGVELADPSFNVSLGVDMVLGIESFFNFFRSGRLISLGNRLPARNESVCGWVVCGGTSVSNQSLNMSCKVSASEDLEELVAQFWSCEKAGVTENYSPQEARCEEHFVRTSTERRLAKDAELRGQYRSFMEKYLQLGHMTKGGIAQIQPKRCYLPHHPVVKHASTTTKVMLVADVEICLDPDPSVKTLGLTWMPGTDTLRFQFNVLPPLDEAETLTKRKVLSIIATPFDPLGLIGAAITAYKVFMQMLWTLKNEDQARLDWDHQLPDTVGETWRSFH